MKHIREVIVIFKQETEQMILPEFYFPLLGYYGRWIYTLLIPFILIIKEKN